MAFCPTYLLVHGVLLVDELILQLLPLVFQVFQRAFIPGDLPNGVFVLVLDAQ